MGVSHCLLFRQIGLKVRFLRVAFFTRCPKMLFFLILASGASADCGFKGSCPRDAGLYPCPDDCGMFVQCGNGIPYETDCPEHTYFNPRGPDSGICDYHCPWTSAPETTTEEVFTTPSPPLECYDGEEDCDSPVFSPDKIYPCNNFYICQAGQLCLYECPDDLIFDPNDNRCKAKGEGPACINTGNKDPLDPFKPDFKASNLS